MELGAIIDKSTPYMSLNQKSFDYKNTGKKIQKDRLMEAKIDQGADQHSPYIHVFSCG